MPAEGDDRRFAAISFGPGRELDGDESPVTARYLPAGPGLELRPCWSARQYSTRRTNETDNTNPP
jgi:hypothetical protein